jgi:hypothetical protein
LHEFLTVNGFERCDFMYQPKSKKPPANVHDGSEVTADSDDEGWKKEWEEEIARHKLEMEKWRKERGLWYVFGLGTTGETADRCT